MAFTGNSNYLVLEISNETDGLTIRSFRSWQRNLNVKDNLIEVELTTLGIDPHGTTFLDRFQLLEEIQKRIDEKFGEE